MADCGGKTIMPQSHYLLGLQSQGMFIQNKSHSVAKSNVLPMVPAVQDTNARWNKYSDKAYKNRTNSN